MKTENVQRLRRIIATLRATGKPAAAYLADDIDFILIDETDQAGLTHEEVDLIKHGRPIDAIKSVRARRQTTDGGMFGLREAKNLVEAAAEQLGLAKRGPDGFMQWPPLARMLV